MREATQRKKNQGREHLTKKLNVDQKNLYQQKQLTQQ